MNKGAEMIGEAVTAHTKGKKAPKVLDHLRISRSLDGGHVIEHHYTSYQHEPKAYKFGPDEGDRAATHALRHSGLPHPKLEEQGDSEPEPID